MVGPSFGHVATAVTGLLLIEKLCFQLVFPPWLSYMESAFATMGRTKAIYSGSFASGLFTWVGLATLMALPAMFRVSQWKIQPNKELDWNMLGRSMPLIIFNFLLGQILGPGAFLMTLPESAWDMRQLPTTTTLLRDIIVWMTVEEIIFFYLHRWMHENKKMYAAVHKIHHTWTSPVSYVAIYCHPFEHVLCNLLPFLAGPILCGSHILAAGVYLTVGTIHTLAVHSGYWFCDDNGMHDMHHAKFNVNYGVLGVMDTLYGTLKLPEGAAGATVSTAGVKAE
jgi:methylsterol monooxygenase